MAKRPNFILLNGAMGSGKSTIADLLRKKLEHTAILEIEDIRKLVTGEEDNALAWEVIYKMCEAYFKNDVNVLLKQTVASEAVVGKFLYLAKKYRAQIHFYHLEAPKNELLKRISLRYKSRKVPKSLIANNLEKHEKIRYPQATIVDTSKKTATQISKMILENLK